MKHLYLTSISGHKVIVPFSKIELICKKILIDGQPQFLQDNLEYSDDDKIVTYVQYTLVNGQGFHLVEESVEEIHDLLF